VELAASRLCKAIKPEQDNLFRVTPKGDHYPLSSPVIVCGTPLVPATMVKERTPINSKNGCTFLAQITWHYVPISHLA
jgi:hypothetical protein